ncbi:unnamed protein product [Rhizoctonia solani]|uniref:Uncharacterized protein n=1 Tax=Rhizoctonia solani TaxID=456999 RepID=A0A8H2WAR8_9AGAM|nr:unnamed protein product [Rhizoctonia solani]
MPKDQKKSKGRSKRSVTLLPELRGGSEPPRQLPTPEDSSAPCAWSPATSPETSPAPRSNSPPSPPPLSRKRRSPSPEAGPSKRRRGSPSAKSAPETMASHPYDTCPTSYKQVPKKRGVRYMTTVNGKEEIRRTPMERLVTRKAKYNYVREQRHLFGDKHGCYFNPYSYSRVNEGICKRIEKPPGFQIGRGGPGTKPIHELIGLRDNYDYRLDIAKSIRKALIKYKPKSLNLRPDQNLTYSKHYGSSSRTNIHNYMLERYPFLYHYRNESGEDNWAINAFCISALASNSSYIKAGNNKANIYLKRNESGPRGQDEDDGDDEDDDCKPSVGYEDDYALNARAARTTQNTYTASKRPRPSGHSSKSRRGHDDDSQPRKQQHEERDERSTRPTSLPSEPSAADFRRASKVVAKEDARNKVLGASRDKVGAKPVAAPKGNGEKRASAPVPSKSKRNRIEDDDNNKDDLRDSDGEPAHLILKKRISPSLSDSEPAPKSTIRPKSTKATPKRKGKDTTKVGKDAKRKNMASQSCMCPGSPVTDLLKRKAPPKDTDEELEEELEQLPKRKRPFPKAPPPQHEEYKEDEELPRLPPSLIPQLTSEPTPARGKRGQNDEKARYLSLFIYSISEHKLQGGNGGEHSTSTLRRVLVEASLSKASNNQANPVIERTNTQELVKSGKAKAIGSIKIKIPAPAPDRILRGR